MIINKTELNAIREKYKKGVKVELIQMDDPQAPPIGTKGTVKFVDDVGTIHIAWETGSSLGLIPGLDKFKIIEQ